MILLRHGQSHFNVHFTRTRRDPGIVDPSLTDEGLAQARQAAEGLRGENLARIITSPYTRTLQTAETVASRLRIPVFVNPLVRERYAFTCDVGTPRLALERAWPDRDFATIDEVWWPAATEAAEGVIARAALFRAEMAALPDWSATLVVSHWGFILAFTGRSLMNGEWLRADPTAPPPPDIVWRP
ncbi:MAG: histidine phosphatase family protein [Acetobacteraceae bacterium]|nr:histidine phosphatase family protein [Acetobacteraceae bacterium]